MQGLMDTIIRFIGDTAFTSSLKRKDMQDLYELILDQAKDFELARVDYENKTIEFKGKSINNGLICRFSPINKLDVEQLSGVFEFYPTIVSHSSLDYNFVGDSSLEYVMDKRSGETKLGIKLQRVRKNQDGIVFENIMSSIDGHSIYDVQFFSNFKVYNIEKHFYENNPNASLYSFGETYNPLFPIVAKHLSNNNASIPTIRRISCRRMKRDNVANDKYEVFVFKGDKDHSKEVIRTDSVISYLKDAMESLIYIEYGAGEKIV